MEDLIGGMVRPSLFATPDQVRDRVRTKAMRESAQSGGAFGLLGYGIGRLFGDPAQSPEATREIRLKTYQQQFAEQNQDITPENYNQKARQYVAGLMQFEPELAIQMMSQMPQVSMKPGDLSSGSYATQKEKNLALTTIGKEYRTDISAPRQALTGYETVMKKYNKVEGDLNKFNGADDMVLMRTFVKMQNMDKPEAFMSDDAVATQMAAMGYGSVEQIMNIFKGAGTLDKDGRRVLVDSVGGLADTAYDRYKNVRNMYSERAKSSGLEKEINQFMLPMKGQPVMYEYRTLPDGTMQRRKRE